MIRSYLLVIIIIGSFLYSCTEEKDYRDEVIGTYNFLTVYSFVMLDESAGWVEDTVDIIYCISEVRKYGSNQLEIKFGEGIIGPISGGELPQILYPIYEGGVFDFNDYQQGGFTNYTGYISNNKINIYIQYSWLLGGYEKYEIKGTKIN